MSGPGFAVIKSMKKLRLKTQICSLFLGILICLANDLALAQQSCANIFSELPSQSETTRFNSPKNFVSKLFSAFSKNLMEDIEFEGPVLSKVQFKALAKFSSNAGKPLVKGDKVRVISIAELKSEVNTSVGTQILKKNGAFEQRLLAESNIDEKPREVLSFRIFYRNGAVVEAPILVKGDLNSVNFDKGQDQLFEFLNGNSSGIDIVEIAHTHPTYAVHITSQDGSSKVRANELSEGDMMATLDFAQRFPRGIAISIKAILPNGFHYISGVNSGR